MMVSALIEKELRGAPFPVREGVFVAIVGPSGAGKDTLIAHARAAFAADRGSEIDFVRRVVTRQADRDAEDHHTLTADAFDAAEKDGAFAISWRAHGLGYGLPADIDELMHAGRVVVANVSRGVIAALRDRYANVTVVCVTADKARLAERIAARGRETKAEALSRLDRAGATESIEGAIIIDNSGAPEIAGARFIAILRKAMAWTALSGAK